MARQRAHVSSTFWTTTTLIAWAVVVFFVHVIPVDPEQARSIHIPHLDKLVHFTLFFVLSALAIHRRLKLHDTSGVRDFSKIILLCCAYGIALEWTQPWAGTHRSSDALDGVADVFGVVLGALCFGGFRRLIFFRH
jgi:VanZ family protein